MSSHGELRSFSAVLRVEIAVLRETRDSLPSDSHLRTLCDLTMERLQSFGVADSESPVSVPLGRASRRT